MYSLVVRSHGTHIYPALWFFYLPTMCYVARHWCVGTDIGSVATPHHHGTWHAHAGPFSKSAEV